MTAATTTEEAPRRGLPRVVEVLLAGVALVLTSPLMALAATAVTITSPGGAFFRQERLGPGGTTFTLLKLRSMRRDAPGSTVTAAGDPRVTPVGRFLRRTKLDELPELWNVVRGDLRLVGPRPEVPAYLDHDDPLWRAILDVRPGLTHPVTLALRDEEEILRRAAPESDTFYRRGLLPWKLRGYATYETHRTVLSDVSILWNTLFRLLAPSSSSAPPPAWLGPIPRPERPLRPIR